MRKAFLPWVPLPRLVWKQEILLTNSVIACFEWRTVTAILWLKATFAWVVLVLRWHVTITASTGVIPPAQSRSTDKIKKALGFVLCDSWLADLCLWALLSFCSPLREQTIYQHSAPLVFYDHWEEHNKWLPQESCPLPESKAQEHCNALYILWSLSQKSPFDPSKDF